LEEGGLSVLVDVGGRIGDGCGEAFAEAGVVEFVAAACRRNNDTIGTGERGDERRAGGAAVNEDERAVERCEPGGDFLGGDVGAAEVEPGFAAVEGAVAEIDDPGGRARGGFAGGAPGAELLAVGGGGRVSGSVVGGVVEADQRNGRADTRGGGFPGAGGGGEAFGVIAFARGADDDEE